MKAKAEGNALHAIAASVHRSMGRTTVCLSQHAADVVHVEGPSRHVTTSVNDQDSPVNG